MNRLVFRPAASRDLEAIWDYVAERNEPAAERLIATIWETCTLLSRSPLIGRSRDELAPDLRSFPVGNHVVFYRPTKGGIEVVRILSGARDIPPLF
jgi:toxin ParE1/3/4